MRRAAGGAPWVMCGAPTTPSPYLLCPAYSAYSPYSAYSAYSPTPSPSLSTFLCSALFSSAAVRVVPGSPLCLVRCEPNTHNVSITNPPVETWPPHCRGSACKLCRKSHPPDHLIAIVTSERSLWALHGFCI